MNKSILLIIGSVISAFFIVFSTSIFEIMYYESEFSLQMYENSLYVTVSIISVCIAWGGAAIYYYVINSVSFSRWFHWLIILLLASLISSIVGYLICNSVFLDAGYDFSTQLFNFSLRVFMIEFILFIIVSFSIRWWSSNCRHTPIPE